MNATNAGSKRKARLLAREWRRVVAVNKRLSRIYQLSTLLKSEQELDLYLRQIPDAAVRAETKKLIEPFLLFRLKRVEMASSLSPEKATVMECDSRFIHMES